MVENITHPVGWLPIIALLPLLGALINGLFGKRLGRGFVSVVAVTGPLVAFTITLAMFFALLDADHNLAARAAARLTGKPSPGTVVVVQGDRDVLDQVARELSHPRGGLGVPVQDEGYHLRLRGVALDDPRLAGLETRWGVKVGAAAGMAPRAFVGDWGRWISAGGFEARFKFVGDRLALILALVVTGVGTLIHLYSTGYMHHESRGGYARYFTYLNLFVGSMLVLVFSGDLLLMFIGWEGVGMCSYLLIGFDYHDPDKAACGTKAFVVNRVGDFGFVLGMLTLLVVARQAAGPDGVFGLDIAKLNQLAPTVVPSVLGVACLLLFIGATGKSAQIPLHIWLPDAMAGPTPVSALIHAATMVTAGVYMIARLSGVFVEATLPVGDGVPVLSIVAVIGMLTAFFAGAAALGQDDIKRVLAYSTVSQLGYMFVGVGVGAMGAAFFHLVTHAFFKALLFLGAGAVIHATHTQSLRQMGGLKGRMPVTFWTMTIGALALAGLVPFSGFFSKDLILFELLARAHPSEAGSAPVWAALYWLGVGTAAVTAIYSVRLICLTFLGEYRGHGEPHDAPAPMTAPLVILAGLALVAGILGIPELWWHEGGNMLPKFLTPSLARPEAVGVAVLTQEHAHGLEIRGLTTGILVGTVAAVLAFLVWGARRPESVAWERAEGWRRPVRALLANAWYYDDLVRGAVTRPVIALSQDLWKWIDDRTIDRGLVDGAGRTAVQLSFFTRVFQTGRVARYAGYLVIGAVLMALYPALYALLKS